LERLKHLILIITTSWFVLTTGTVGYMVIEGWNFIDSLYMTVITVATVGFGETHTLSSQGHIFTIILIFLGVGFFAYVGGFIVQFAVEGQIKQILESRRLEKSISKLKNHYIICGYGRIGRVLYRHLLSKLTDIVIVEQDIAIIHKMEKEGLLYVGGPATEEKNLLKAGIKNAKGLIAVLGTDTDNVFLVLSARQLNPNLYIVARACNESSKKTLKAAGADKVESPYDIGAIRMAQTIIRPTVVNFLDYAFARSRRDIQMEELTVSSKSEITDKTLMESGIRQKFNLIIIAIKKEDGKMIFNPSSHTQLFEGDTIVAIGQSDALSNFEKILNP